MTKEQIIKIFHKTIYVWHDKIHYNYQRRIAEAIISAVIDASDGQTIELPIRFPRQSGKTTAVVDVIEFLLANSLRYFGRPLSIGIFAPEKEQATTDFDRLKLQFADIMKLGFTTRVKVDSDKKFPEKWNSKGIRIYKRSTGQFLGEVYIFPITKTSNPESKTLDLIIVEETQDVDDERMKNAVFPMGASTNAPRIYVGSAGYKVCVFKRQIESNPKAIQITIDQVFADRRKMAEVTGNKRHLLYEAFVQSEIKNEGKDSPYIRTQFFGEWVIGAGQFTTAEKLDAMIDKGRGIVDENKTDLACYVGIDTAKHVDQTWVTVLRDRADNKADEPNRSDLLGWLVLQGDNYEDQFDYIKSYLSKFERIRGIAIDATGQGDFMPDKFERNTGYNIIRVKFTPESKDVIYKILLQVIENKATRLPDDINSRDYLNFRAQMLDLQREQKGRYMSVHHPDAPKAHDDAPDAWALAEYAKTVMIANQPEIHLI